MWFLDRKDIFSKRVGAYGNTPLRIAFFGFFMLLAACTKQEHVDLFLNIENALAPAGLVAEELPLRQQVKKFRVYVTGSGISVPILLEATPDGAGISLKDIPEGDQRTLLVEALNNENMVVRRKEIKNITIDKQKLEPITVSLNTVPIFLNLRNGNRVIVTRLMMQGSGEPNHQIEVQDASFNQSLVLKDNQTGLEFAEAKLSLGQFNFLPPELALGRHTFILRDLTNGESSQVTVRLAPPGSLPGTGIVSFGQSKSPAITSGAVPFYSFDTDLAHFPHVMSRSKP